MTPGVHILGKKIRCALCHAAEVLDRNLQPLSDLVLTGCGDKKTIFNHEFGHILYVSHHYAGTRIQKSRYMPPGEDYCIMARNSNEYCSGCRAAMNLDLDADNNAEITLIGRDIMQRYP